MCRKRKKIFQKGLTKKQLYDIMYIVKQNTKGNFMQKEISKIVAWYYSNNRPNREAIRNGDVKVPDGFSTILVESLIPLIRQKEKEERVNNEVEDNKEKTIVVASDFHIPFLDKEAFGVFLEFLYEFQPSELVLNGNINDCTAFSPHPKQRELVKTLSDGKLEKEYWFSIATSLRRVLPNSKIKYIGSQCHEGWIDKWVSLSPILVEDDNYTIEKWFRLEDYGIEFIPEVYDPIGNKELLITHGTIARGKSGSSAMAELEYSGTSVIQGHTHRLGQVYKTNELGEFVGIECGCLCERKPWYRLKGKRGMMDWQQGFVIVNVKDNSFSTQVIPILRDGEDKPYFWVGKQQYR